MDSINQKNYSNDLDDLLQEFPRLVKIVSSKDLSPEKKLVTKTNGSGKKIVKKKPSRDPDIGDKTPMKSSTNDKAKSKQALNVVSDHIISPSSKGLTRSKSLSSKELSPKSNKSSCASPHIEPSKVKPPRAISRSKASTTCTKSSSMAAPTAPTPASSKSKLLSKAKSLSMASSRTISDTPIISDCNNSTAANPASTSSNMMKTSKMMTKRARALEESKLAAKKKLDEYTKQIQEDREKERQEHEARVLKKTLSMRNPLPVATSSGFFSDQMIKPLSPKKDDRKAMAAQPVIVEPIIPEFSEEELAAMKEEEERMLRAKALVDSMAAAKARYDATPKGKIALEKEQRIAARQAAREAKIAMNRHDDSSHHIIDEEHDEEEIHVLTPEDHARIDEEASYASVDAAFAQSKQQEVAILSETIISSVDDGERYITHIQDIIASTEICEDDAINSLDELLDEATDHMKNIRDLYAQAQAILEEVSNAAADAVLLSSKIKASSTVEDAVQLAEATSSSAEKASTKAIEMKKIWDELSIAVDAIIAVDADVLDYHYNHEDDDMDDEDDNDEEDEDGDVEHDESVFMNEKADESITMEEDSNQEADVAIDSSSAIVVDLESSVSEDREANGSDPVEY